MANIVPREEFPAIVNIYNTEGRSGAYDYIRSKYGVKNPYFVVQRLNKCENYTYDGETDKFIATKMSKTESLFLSLDTLCGNHTAESETSSDSISEKSEAMEKLVKELISDRLLEISCYITIDTIGKAIYVDSNTIRQNGYRLQVV